MLEWGMPVAASQTPLDPEVVRRARALFGTNLTIGRCRGGRNSRVYRIDQAGRTYALKFYPDDRITRAKREYAAVSFFAASGILGVPKPVIADLMHNVAAYTWLDGEAITRADTSDMAALAAFAAQLHGLRGLPSATVFEDAIGACFDAATILRQIDIRAERLVEVTGEAALGTFLDDAFFPVLAGERVRVDGRPEAPVPSNHRTLSPSDFGLHNALRAGSGELAFFDFEYFGWDDPVKLVSDVCWHPGMALASNLRECFIAHCIGVFAGDATFERRLHASYALYGLRWCMIVLNEFVPELWERRVSAGLERPAEGVKHVQLQKAYGLLGRVVEYTKLGTF